MLSAADARTHEQVCRLQRDNWATRDYWLLADGGTVTLCQQRNGEASTAKITVPRAQFNRLVQAYLKPQRVRPRG